MVPNQPAQPNEATADGEPDRPIASNISPAKRKKLQTYFEYGSEKREKGDYDYAHSMFAQCYVADPANLVYLEALLANLAKKFHGKKKKAKVRSNRAAFKKAHGAKQWRECIRTGLELLNENPWDVPTLRALAEAAAEMRPEDERFSEVELRFLRAALDSDPKNIDVNKHCAESLARIGQYDQAIACLHRIEELVSNKAEIQKQISQMTIAKTARASGVLDEDQPRQPPAATKNADEPPAAASAAPQRHSVEGLEQAIAQDPTNIENYLELADLLTRSHDLTQAEAALRRALAASGSDLKIREKLENVELRRGRAQLATAEQQAQTKPSEDARQLVEKLKQDLNRLELDVYRSRVERYPENLANQYELAVRLKRAGSFQEAAEYFAATVEVENLAAAAALQWGECLQQLRKYQEAQTRYLQAIKLAQSAQKTDVLKLTLYRGGVLAAGLKNWQQAQSLLEQLVALEPDYRDAQSRLDKLKLIGDT